MKYEKFVSKVAAQAGVSQEAVRDVLYVLPDVLIELDDGEEVRTHLGVFRMTRRKARTVTLPDRKRTAQVPEAQIVKLRSGTRLYRDTGD